VEELDPISLPQIPSGIISSKTPKSILQIVGWYPSI